VEALAVSLDTPPEIERIKSMAGDVCSSAQKAQIVSGLMRQ
jgi:hypothetical protein